MSHPRAPGRATAPDPNPPSESAILLRRVQHGDEAALESLMEMHWGGLLRYATRILDSEDAAEDVVQEAFVRLWNLRAGDKAGASAAAFLYTAIRNLCLNEKRRLRVRARFAVRSALFRRGGHLTPLDDLEAGELEAAARRAIESLPPRRREAFELARHHNLSHQEIAQVMGISPQTVANQMSTALDYLRSQLRSHTDPSPLD